MSLLFIFLICKNSLVPSRATNAFFNVLMHFTFKHKVLFLAFIYEKLFKPRKKENNFICIESNFAAMLYYENSNVVII